MDSLICKYTNGYQAHYIDKLPNKDSFRSVDSDPSAYPEETIVILKDGAVACFCIDIPGLEDVEQEMKLIKED